MEMSQIALNQGITFLCWATGVTVVVIGGFLIKLILDVSKLTKNLNETSILINTELKPTLKQINETLTSVNSIIKSTDKGVDSFKLAVEQVFGKTKLVTETIFGGIIKGFVTAFKVFSKGKNS
jgi:predicted PurR-regulated permease PerM